MRSFPVLFRNLTLSLSANALAGYNFFDSGTYHLLADHRATERIINGGLTTHKFLKEDVMDCEVTSIDDNNKLNTGNFNDECDDDVDDDVVDNDNAEMELDENR